MNPSSDEGAARLSSNTALALVAMVVWVTAAASTSHFGIWLAIGVAAIGLGVAVLVFDPVVSRKLLRPSLKLLLIGAATGMLMALATFLFYPVLTRIAPFIECDAELLYSAFRAPPRVVAALALPLVILGEELVWRSVVQSAVMRLGGTWGGATLAAGAYAIVHTPVGSPVLVFLALVCGLCWSALRAATGSLVPALVAHLVWDLLVLLWLPLDSQ